MRIGYTIRIEIYFMDYYGIFRDFPLHRKGESRLHIDETSMFDSDGFSSYPRSDNASEVLTILKGSINIDPIERKNIEFGSSYVS